jgi:hypothetical protein
MLRDADDLRLALGPADGAPTLPRFFHFGFEAPDRDRVHRLRERPAADGMEIVEHWDEPTYCSVKWGRLGGPADAPA